MSSNKGEILNPFEHAYKRPDAYIGKIKSVSEKIWLYDETTNLALPESAVYNTGLFNIIREIVSNAIDNVWRSATESPETLVKKISISINTKTGEISIWNDGYCIPVRLEEYDYTDPRTKIKNKQLLYPPEVFFGDMFTSTNFDDTKIRKTSGRNGMGAKATIVFSTFFKVECANPDDKKVFIQTYSNNGTERTKPEIFPYKQKYGYTKISFIPDYKFFGYPNENEFGVDENLIRLLKLYACEVSMITSLSIRFYINDDNEKIFKIPSLEKYVRLFYPNIDTNKLIAITSPLTKDECVIVEVESPEYDEQENIKHTAFINGIKTKLGGIHVEAWKDALLSSFVRAFNQRKTDKQIPKVSAKQVYPYLHLFLRCEADRPCFSSQPKDELTEIFDEKGNSIPYSLFDSKKKKEKEDWNLMLDGAIKKMLKWNFISSLEEKLLNKADKSLSRQETTSKRVSDKRYDHANEAGPGKKNAEKCTLYITEGLSAKSLVVRGISSIEDGKDFNGAFAIRGKFINVQNATTREINANEEIVLLKNILNLKRGVDYSLDENFKTLSYGKVCIMTDADDDGIHIRGLLLNFFYKEYPTLIQRNYISSFSTAVTAVTFKQPSLQRKLFFSNPEFKKWMEDYASKEKIKDVKYYKGLGSIGPQDAPDYFESPKIVEYFFEGTEDEFMDLGFNSKSSDKRKTWIVQHMKPSFQKRDDDIIIEDETEDEKVVANITEQKGYVYQGPLSISTFVDKQLIIFHQMALRRALPGLWDGFKECQRKIFYAIRLKNYKKTLDLEKVMGAVKEITYYHHGASALLETITKMAQGFVGRNNIPLLVNDGEFGTRSGAAGVGADHAAPRYIATMEEEIAGAIFSKLDDDLLTNVVEDNETAEYETYMPVVPMLLINGAEGIGCGWSTTIPNYNPEDLVRWIRKWMNGNEKTESPLKPWYRGFTGEIGLIKNKSGEIDGWYSRGILEKDTENKAWWHIRELPIGVWTKPFEEWLIYLMNGTIPEGKKWKKNDVKYIKQIKDYCGANFVHFMIEPTKDFIPDIDIPSNMGMMKTKESLRNMMALDENNYPHKFNSPEEYLYIFCERRLEFYQKRKDYLLKVWNIDLKKASNRYRFVKAVGVDKKLDLHVPDDELEKVLEGWKFDRVLSGKEESYDYLLSMQMRSMTQARLQELQKEVEKIKIQIDTLSKKSSKDLWNDDLDIFEKAYQKFLTTRCEEKTSKKRKTKEVPDKKAVGKKPVRKPVKKID